MNYELIANLTERAVKASAIMGAPQATFDAYLPVLLRHCETEEEKQIVRAGLADALNLNIPERGTDAKQKALFEK